MTTRPALVALLLSLLVALPAFAVEPHERLDDPVLEERARVLSQNIRCLVCQNESIDSSNADLAKELRVLVRERLVAGDSDEEVLSYLVSRYGDYVLLEPPVKPSTYLLWFGPILLLLLGILAVWAYYRRQPATAATPLPLSAAEQERLARLLDDEAAGQAEPPERA